MINAFCFFHGEDSWSRHARLFFHAWQKQERVLIHSWNQPAPGEVASESVHPRIPLEPDAPGIGLGPIELMTRVTGSRRIAYVVWETTIMPPDKVAILQSMDEVWVPSSWGRYNLIANGLAPDRVRIVPEGVDVEKFRPAEAERVEKQRPFRFLFVGKWEERKGVDLLIKAWRTEFRPDEPVQLVVHGWNRYVPGFDLAANIRRSVGRRVTAPILASLPGSEEDLVGLYRGCDAFVLPTRAEGWGLPITEAMACALPVIVTDYSAPTDYLNDKIAYLIAVRKMVPVRDRYFFPAGRGLGKWAEPDLDSLRRLMRRVYENPDEAREKGRLARAEVCARWTWDDAASTARQVLSRP